MKRNLLMVVVLFSSVCATAWSEITVRPMSLYFQAGGAPYKDILVSNKSHNTAYVDIQAVELLNPGTQKTRIKTAKNPRDFGLLVTPIRSKISAKQGKSVRVSILQPPGEQERDYRLWVRPVPGQLHATGGKPATPQMYLQVLTAYYVYVHVLPSKSVHQVSLEQHGKTITVKNTGNVVVELRDGKQCDTQNHCNLLPKKTLYPNGVWQLVGKSDLPVSFGVYVGRQEVEVISTK